MSAETLRRAAKLMRDVANAVPPDGLQDAWFDAEAPDLMHLKRHDRDQIASWHPAVALAVADWLGLTADWIERRGATPVRLLPPERQALAVARAYLGEVDA